MRRMALLIVVCIMTLVPAVPAAAADCIKIHNWQYCL